MPSDVSAQDVSAQDVSAQDVSAQDVSAQELMAVFLARDLKDTEHLMVGVAMPIVEAAVRLAHLLHGPNMELIFFGTRMNVADRHTLPMPAFAWDSRVVRWAESFSDTGHRFEDVKHWHKRVFFIGGVQVDPHGNTNLIGVGPDYATLRFRGPVRLGRQRSAPTWAAIISSSMPTRREFWLSAAII